jgi:hypothetical protein
MVLGGNSGRRVSEDDPQKAFYFFGTLFCVVPFGVGLSFLVTALAYKHTYIGTLVHAHIGTNSGPGGGESYSVVEDFTRGSSSTTCAVKRMAEYFTEGDANRAANSTILGTERRIWEYWNRSGHCYDQDIRNYNFAVGVTLLAFSFFIVGCPLSIYLKSRCSEWDCSLPSLTRQSRSQAAAIPLPSSHRDQPWYIHTLSTSLEIEKAEESRISRI